MPSVAESATVTALYDPSQAALLQLIVVVGAAVSIWIGCDLTASALPALSTEKNFTAEVLVTVNGAV